MVQGTLTELVLLPNLQFPLVGSCFCCLNPHVKLAKSPYSIVIPTSPQSHTLICLQSLRRSQLSIPNKSVMIPTKWMQQKVLQMTSRPYFLSSLKVQPPKKVILLDISQLIVLIFLVALLWQSNVAGWAIPKPSTSAGAVEPPQPVLPEVPADPSLVPALFQGVR